MSTLSHTSSEIISEIATSASVTTDAGISRDLNIYQWFFMNFFVILSSFSEEPSRKMCSTQSGSIFFF